jgi:PAS domain S-box-containing protein
MNALFDQFRLIINSIPDPICLIGCNGAIGATNPAFCRLLGFPESELLDKSMSMLTVESVEAIEQKLKNWRRSGSPLPSAIEFQTQGQGTIKCTTYGNLLNPSASSDQTLILLRVKTRQSSNKGFAALNDQIKQLEKQIVERKRAARELQESEARIRLILESAGEMIFGIDKQGKMSFVNPAFMKIMGYEDDTPVIGEDAMELLGQTDPERKAYPLEQAPIRLSLINEAPIHSEREYFTKSDGSVFPVEYRCFPIVQDDSIIGVVVTATDITQRRRAQDEINRLNKDLERRVEERTAELERAISKLAQSEKLSALGDLVAGVAHEINTPIGIGVTSATHLQERGNYYRQLYEKGKLTQGDFESFMKVTEDSCNILVANLNRSANLVRSFKQVAVDQVSESRREFNVRQYIEEIIQSLHPKLKKTNHRIEIECQNNIYINSFPGAFAQIITNFIINSLIHGFEHTDAGQITIAVEKNEGYLIFKYSDNGVGMNDDAVKKVFDPFYSTRRGRGGTGLGMHVVYNLVTNTFNGSIECESAPNEGVQFLMRLHVPSVYATSSVETKEHSG